MAGGVAHHFNNKLAVVLGNLELAQYAMSPETEAYRSIVEAEKAACNAAELSGLMLTYLGQQQHERIFLDLSQTCADYLAYQSLGLPENVTLDLNLPIPGPGIMADIKILHQVINALIVNAWEAMGDDIPGTITVSTGTVSSPPNANEYCFPVDWKGSPQDFACLTITDTGKGMDAATIEKIFDPFSTEKFTGRGMGLPTTLGNINAHGGCITVESIPGKGSTFQIFLPLSV